MWAIHNPLTPPVTLSSSSHSSGWLDGRVGEVESQKERECETFVVDVPSRLTIPD
jgi:hypothetical protein